MTIPYNIDLTKEVERILEKLKEYEIEDHELFIEVYKKIIHLEIMNLIHDATGRFLNNCEVLKDFPIEKFLETRI